MSDANGHGRPSKYLPEYDQRMIDYFNRPLLKENTGSKPEAEELPQFIGFAQEIGVGFTTLDRWKKEHPSFRKAYNHCKKLQEQMIVGNSIQNRYNPYFAQFMLKNCHQWRDESQQQVENVTVKVSSQEKNAD